jgi:predicted amino acid racemase/D-alanyl-D-alanine dipeptidase
MLTPRIEIDLEKIAHNVKNLVALYGSKGIEVTGVTKSVCGNPDIAAALVRSGIRVLADSRIENIKRMRNAGVDAKFMLLRTPSLSQAESVVKYADMSLNSEISVIQRLSTHAAEYDQPHKIILMIELGDLREGVMLEDIHKTIDQIIELKGVSLVGIGTNLACFGGIKPNQEKMAILSACADDIEKSYDITLDTVSGGNSANYDWFMATQEVGRINNLRLGESIFLGCETLSRKPIPGLHTDAITLVTEIIESKTKPSLPFGEIGQDAFGRTPAFSDQGTMRRAILAVGLQDVQVSGLKPRKDIEIMGASSDHVIVDIKQLDLKVGSELEFDLNYSALLSAMTSKYVNKVSSDRLNAHEYCEQVEQKYRRHLQAMPNIMIKDDQSALMNLNESGFNLMFEPSIQEGYRFLVRAAVYDKIGRISKRLDLEDKTLWLRSAYRSFEHQQRLWESRVASLQKEFPQKELEEIEELVSYFIAPPSKSMHSTGGAVDALIYDLTTDSILRFGTNDGYKINLNDKCYPYHPYITPEAKNNRRLLIDLFQDEDFVVDIKEYWHFDYGNVSWAIEKGRNQAMFGIIKA